MKKSEMKLKLMGWLKEHDNQGCCETLAAFEGRMKLAVKEFNEKYKTRFAQRTSFCDYLEYAGYE